MVEFTDIITVYHDFDVNCKCRLTDALLCALASRKCGYSHVIG